MRRIVSIVLSLLLILSLNIMLAQEKTKDDKKMEAKDKETTVKGEVVDVACYLAHGDKGKGDNHKGCAEACAKGGGSLGILTDDGKLYISLLPDDHKNSPNAKLMDHIAHKVEATGKVRSKGGVEGIMITKVEMENMNKKAEKK